MNNTLFEPIFAGDIALKNRVVMAPMTRTRAGEDGIPKAMHAKYYAQRASAGLIITEGANISPQGRGYAGTPGIWNAQQAQGWAAVTEAVHANNGKIVLQLWHVGSLSHVSLQRGGASPVGPSGIRAGGTVYTAEGAVEPSVPRALATEEMKDIVAQYRAAAQLAKEAGFDGVEIHAANGYLLDQFLRDSTNRRQDSYGGSIENRSRLSVEVTQAIVDVWGAGRVGIRLSPISTQLGDTALDSDVMATYGYLIEKLNGFGLAYLHFVEGITGGSRANPPGIDLDALGRKFNGIFIGNNGYDIELARQRIEDGLVDLVAFGRPFISNPDLVERLRGNLPLTPADPSTFYGDSEKGLTDWPPAN
ncbi:alkene reductase [Rheinheimera oceanensis]|uniref:alkene reductase n=1 Tax=Rheinheimera oceanensis TaxID=2817449 RepID=UPI001BFCEA4C|nr:alkene reductase [Rheinheimera oceanensis]